MKYNKLRGEGVQVINYIKSKLQQHHIQAYSGHMAFYLTMSIFPFLIVLVTIIGKLSLDSEFLFEYMKFFVPADIGVFLEEYIANISFNATGIISISLIITIWSSSRAVHAMMRAFNVVFEVEENRNYFQLRLTGFFYTLVLIIAIVLFLFLPIIGRTIIEFFNPLLAIPNIYIVLYGAMRWVIITVFFFFVILLAYTQIPNRKISFREAIPGALFSLMGWLMNAIVYSYIITNFGRISIIYGGISAIILLSFWLYINSIIIMLGAEMIRYVVMKKS